MFDVGSAYKIIKLKGYTSWAIGIMVSTLCSAILRNQRQLYTLSTNAQACYSLIVTPVFLNIHYSTCKHLSLINGGLFRLRK